VTQRTSPSPQKETRRASPEAVEKRRAARLFNQALLGEAGPSRDGRTERRRKRLLKELSDGMARGGKRELKPIDVLSRVQELLALGEPLASIRKACPRPRPVEITEEILEGIRRIHRAYTFPIAAYAFVGLPEEALREAGIPAGPGLRRAKPRRGEAARPPAKAGTRGASKRRRGAA
jgi:hypothetical protein